jgi:thiamine biosynthesis lipoprotein
MNKIQIMNYNNKTKGRVICLFFVFAALAGCKNENKVHKNNVEGSALGTTYHITYLGTQLDSVDNKVDSIVFAVNHGLSTYQKNSLVTCYNTNSNEIWSDPNEAKHFENDMQHMVEMVSLSKTISNETNGAFDPSAAQLFSLYDQAKKDGVLMDNEKVEECLSHQGMQKVQFDEQGYPYKLDSFVQLNFNAIAKGYLVDIIADYLDSNGVDNFMVEVGGEMRVKGHNADSKSWQVGINVPLIQANSDDFFKILELQNVSLATSGNYQNYYEVDGEIIGHTLDPRSGEPVISNLKSVSILHDYCAVADAYATACMVMGLEESTKIIKQNTSLSAYFIYEEKGELKGVYVE